MYGYDSFINDVEEGTVKGDPIEEEYKGLPSSHEIDYIIDNSEEERTTNSYDQFIGAEVFLTGRKDEKLMGKIRKNINYDDISTVEGQYNTMHNKSVY